VKYFDDLEFINGSFAHKNDAKAENKLFDGYYGIQFILRGDICVHVEGEEPWQAAGPLVFFTAPGRRYSYYTSQGTREHLFLCFRGPRVQRFMEGRLFPAEAGRKISVTAPEELLNLFSEILLCLRKQDLTSHGEAVLILEKILLHIANQPKSRQKSSAFRDIIRTLENDIASQPGKVWNFGEIASEHSLSEVHFRRLFINETGVAPWKYVLNCRIRYACQLLHSSSLMIKEIADMSGFSNEINFSRQFHKIMKCSPSDFRKRF